MPLSDYATEFVCVLENRLRYLVTEFEIFNNTYAGQKEELQKIIKT